ncbi:hypothetical protein FMM80_00850 [Schaedlerella arabinosiphila]|uniref:Uncharacterized protein n=1 Tax=Schaedlerella arabinosiphila TaxID=2044587 RepID=A0A9X5C9F9_9FIRM|nr:hypothetical protein [Schaedlerella arabinosiphila]KAI4438964.1 hypothetical protein C824_001450 [Schaedlerella arabinosiphila]NDO67356.1 hypothetical protein [Schaedlerella arabinosiphila]
MNYHELSLDELKKIAKEKGISIGNSKQEKIIDKLKQYDLENNTESLINGVDIKEDISVTDNQSEMVYNLETDEKDKKENVIGTINSIVSDLDDFEESDEKDSSIDDIGMDEEVPCMSITFGGLVYTSPITGATYKWHKIGDVEYLTIKELISMNNSKPVFLNRPWIILQDLRAVNKFRLMSKYEEVAKVNQLKKLFSSGNTDLIKSTIDSALKSGMRDVVISKVRTMYNNGVLNNTHIIKLLEEKLRFEIVVD